METLVLKPEIIDSIKKDSILFGSVAKVLGVSAFSLPRILLANDPRLTQASVLKLLRMQLSITKDIDLLCELQEETGV